MAAVRSPLRPDASTVLEQSLQVHCGLHTLPDWKQSQYSLRHFDLWQRQRRGGSIGMGLGIPTAAAAVAKAVGFVEMGQEGRRDEEAGLQC